MLPVKSYTFGSSTVGRIVFNGELVRDPPQKSPANCDTLFKLGRTTNFTAGSYNGLPSLHLNSTTKDGNVIPIVTEEWAICPTDTRFCEKGDAGSFIFEDSPHFIGLLFAGNQDTDVAYFTPQDILFDDIKFMTGASHVRLPEGS